MKIREERKNQGAKVFTKEEVKMLPTGDKIVKILEKFKIYQKKRRILAKVGDQRYQ